ncbi:DsbE family thiol:disulfide interchange protein [Oryzicola mucosus]|uniref:DsbE family thiol:disulfide interchange protein n=1 Tax=Oryzicola mucosus TaxID=2767425 RepID=A0A8J6PLW9_9HYPH|nr:DsbE family thiol:disulfide interchange protein [Oryzicola mucosus]MBD0413977.1 DsbE family thiol:disulfide interchange protein [Oryzicola mucosus]
MTDQTQQPTSARRGPRLIVLLPLLVFTALAGVFLMQLLSGRDIAAVPSALIGQAAPVTSLPPLEGMQLPGLESRDLAGKVTLVNVWASWCAPCREEHPVLLALSQDKRFSIAGLNYKDKPENARRFLGDLGNPFSAIGVDQNGRTAIDWGVYGVPETFLIGKDGKILFKHVGPLSPQAAATTIMPEIEKALAASP